MDTHLKFNEDSLPKIGLGTYQLTGIDGQRAIESAIELGYRNIDTAQLYENEGEVGKALANAAIPREQFFLTTKIWSSDFNRLIEATEQSLRKLKTDYVDLLMLHWPTELSTTQKGLDLLNEVLHKGYARHVGVCNFTIPLLEVALERAPIVCNQVEYHALLSQEKVLDWMRSKGLFLTAYRPLAKGIVTEEPLFAELGESYGKTPGQIALRWLIQQKGVVAIPKAASQKRQLENLHVFDFELKSEDIEQINALPKNKRMVDPDFAPAWD